MLEIKGLSVAVGGEEILQDINLKVEDGEIVALFGPNGCGKTTLLKAIMGYKEFNITEGEIIFDGEVINDLPINQRAELGIGMMFQRPPVVKGVTVRDIIEMTGELEAGHDKLSKKLNVEGFIDRYLNDGFSGGEIKRSELLQLLVRQPELLLLDEPESGVDVENVELIGKTLNSLLHEELIIEDNELTRKELHEHRKRSGLVITHTGHILEYVNTDRAIVFMEGKIVCKGNPGEILDMIKENGFEECKRCNQVI